MRTSDPAGTPTRPRRWLRRLAALVLGLAAAAGAAELVVRFAFGEQPKFPRHVVGAPWGLRFNQPGARYRHKSQDVCVEFRINGQGMRAEEDVAYAKPAGTRRILSLGDSFTVGYEVSEEQCFSRVLESALRAKGVSVEVLNAGVSGFSTAEECLYLERELYKYEPDLVLLSYFENDLLDNVRCGLFRLEGERLVPEHAAYVPEGRLGTLLNTNPVLSWLSERSDAFCLLKESATKLVKQRMVEREADRNDPAAPPTRPEDPGLAQRRLAAAILERIYAWTRERGIPFVVQSIPFPAESGPPDLVDKFPSAEFDVERPGIAFVSMRDVLRPFVGREQLYWQHSHSHWTPFSHARSGEAIAERIVAEHLLP